MTQSTKQYFEDTRGVSIAHMNVRSIPSNIITFRQEFEECDIDCLTISESWLNDTINDNQVFLEGFNLIRHDRQTLTDDGEVQTGGGLCIYMKQIYTYSTEELGHLNMSNANVELQLLAGLI